MAIEYETQVLEVNAEEIKKKLRNLGATEKPEVFQKRYVFDIECLDAQSPGLGEWIRLRQSGDKTELTYKNRRGTGINDTIELEVLVSDFDKTAEILGNLKCFTGQYYQENKRSKFFLNDIEFCLDTWPMIPTILEIESSSEHQVKEGLRLLDLEGKDAGHIGLINIYKKYGLDLHDYRELKF